MKNGLGVTLLVLPVFILSMFGMSVWMESQSFERPRQYTHFVEVGEGFGSCSSVAVAPEQVLTAYHCVEQAADEDIKVSGKLATVLKTDPENDLALLEVEGLACPCAPLAAGAPERDAWVITVGYPLGKLKAVTEGRAMTLVEGYGDGYKLWTTTTLLFGNSGGGLFEFRLGEWQLVGITTMVPGANVGGFYSIPVFNVTLSTPVETVRHFLHRT